MPRVTGLVGLARSLGDLSLKDGVEDEEIITALRSLDEVLTAFVALKNTTGTFSRGDKATLYAPHLQELRTRVRAKYSGPAWTLPPPPLHTVPGVPTTAAAASSVAPSALPYEITPDDPSSARVPYPAASKEAPVLPSFGIFNPRSRLTQRDHVAEVRIFYFKISNSHLRPDTACQTTCSRIQNYSASLEEEIYRKP
jgi:hypothetical protein